MTDYKSLYRKREREKLIFKQGSFFQLVATSFIIIIYISISSSEDDKQTHEMMKIKDS